MDKVIIQRTLGLLVVVSGWDKTGRYHMRIPVQVTVDVNFNGNVELNCSMGLNGEVIATLEEDGEHEGMKVYGAYIES
ncbi:MAG: hypothetical protein NUV56_03080 [Candidatus Uhrbacteria bacterium]|nr:hypothetical protein [Candidatus Uhrbacteria bacterium]